MLRERNDVIKEEEEEEDAVPEGERSEGDGAEELKSEENKAKTEAEIAQETRRKRVSSRELDTGHGLSTVQLSSTTRASVTDPGCARLC